MHSLPPPDHSARSGSQGAAHLKNGTAVRAGSHLLYFWHVNQPMPPSRPSTATPAPWRFVSAGEISGLERWDADYCVNVVATGARWATLSSLGAEIGEGLRSKRVEGSELTLYRPSHFDRGVVVPDDEHLSVEPIHSSRSVGPGDVLVSKFLPPRAALVSPSTPRHAPDSNCLRVVGLGDSLALWLTALLNHPTFSKIVDQLGSGRALPRIGVRELEEMAVPESPVGLPALAAEWNEAADERLDVRRELMALRAEAQELADESAPSIPDPHQPAWVPAKELPSSLAPDQVALFRFQRKLAKVKWETLSPYLLTEPARLREPIPSGRLLRLVDATGDLGFQLPEVETISPPWFRLYAKPLQAGELLLSTLGSSPKVVLNQPPASEQVWMSDQWARLDGGETSGALALALGTEQVAWQLGSATTGAVRQFIVRSDLGEVRVPVWNSASARALHRRVLSILERRSGVEKRLDRLRSQLAEMVATALEVRA